MNFLAFLQARCVLEGDAWSRSSELHEAYARWNLEKGLPAVSQRALSGKLAELAERGVASDHRNAGRGFRGIRLKTEGEGAEPRRSPWVKLFGEAEGACVQTNITDPDLFIGAFSAVLFKTTENPRAFGSWLRHAAEIFCKLRGYKADVHHEQVLTAGEVRPRGAPVAETTA